MSKFNRPGTRPSARPRLHQPMGNTGPATTYTGGSGFARDNKSALLLLAVTNMVGEQTFYEAAGDRDERYRALVHGVAVMDPEWMLGFTRWLRGEANMRSASIVAACEAVKARLAVGLTDNPGSNRKFISSVLQRADEPGELLAYWTSRYGRAIPKPLKRGVADAVQRLYTERNLLKYDTASHGWRFADVIELVHPEPSAPWQGDLFKHALDRRHNRPDIVIPESLGMVRWNAALRRPGVAPEAWLDPAALGNAGMTWEDALSAVGGRVDKARLWEAMIPSMGYMSLLRNLRNFDEAGVSDVTAELVARYLADPEQVARSRQFPYRFLSAYRAAPSLRWAYPLEKALNASLSNVPALPGRTLVLVDTSASMTGTVSERSAVRHVDIGALFGAVLAARGGAVDLVGFANGTFAHRFRPGTSVLEVIRSFTERIGEVGHGTQMARAAHERYDGHDRVVVITDMQAFGYYGGSISAVIPADVPLFGVDTTGHSVTAIDTNQPNRYEIGGFSDKMFTLLALLSRGRDAGWPWEVESR